ncbi:YCF48-related protein [Flavihumibacter rivuli]|uniref:WD40/YVTN/BNR-like repeat-containing protein n=1 Tax=Flavihumibacter rivuli TaxID=2838156 RepID=UPI001BDEFF28|nr:YCF48-related protein [Flavihumibacter rivuli]ULQ57680.1 YCF48-related protein [Flavihumibacter rivuli]
MNNRIFGWWLLLLLASMPAMAQRIIELEGKPGISIRGMSVVNDRIAWVSGSKGTIGRTSNGGKTWTFLTVKGYENRDFRDIEAFDIATAVIMAIDEPALILRTHDGGASWQPVYQNPNKGMFLDAMQFRNKKDGIVLGDPINGKFFLASTHDGGRSWQDLPATVLPQADSGEACFAASGTNIRMLQHDQFQFITGGLKSRVFLDNRVIDLPLLQGQTTTGANSIAVRSKNKWIVVGGDFARDTLQQGNAALTRDGGKTWTSPRSGPFGYRSCVIYAGRKKLVACGTSGVDISLDGGRTWQNISKTGYHVVQQAKDGKAIYLAGGNGRLAKLSWK